MRHTDTQTGHSNDVNQNTGSANMAGVSEVKDLAEGPNGDVTNLPQPLEREPMSITTVKGIDP